MDEFAKGPLLEGADEAGRLHGGVLKQDLRRELLGRRKAFILAQRQEWDMAICRAVCALDWFRRAEAVLGYYPIGSEPDISAVLREAMRLGKTVALPRCDIKTGEMTFHTIRSLEGLRPGAHGIPEPEAQAAGPGDTAPALCLVPAIAFDLRGHRLGYGKGYYDRFLSRHKGHALGICYDALLCGALPIEPQDIAAESVITEKRRLP